jgi:tyrosinase
LITGPFANKTEYIGPELVYEEYCLSRAFNGSIGVEYGTSEIIDRCSSYDNYTAFWYFLDNDPHYGGHTAVGGVVSSPTLTYPFPHLD